MKRRASVDIVIRAFDDAIAAWVDQNIDSLVEGYGQEEVSKLVDELGDRIYHEIQVDPQHLKRFVGFYVTDSKMVDLADDILSGATRAASGKSVTPSEISDVLRQIASVIDASDTPDRTRVHYHLGRILVALDTCADDTCADDTDKGSVDGPVETVAVNIPKKVDDLVKEVKEKNPGYTDAQAWGTAWSIYCKSVSPDSPHCKQGGYFD
jgi:hypothetical protein